MTPDAHLNRPAGCPLALHKRHVDPLDTTAEAAGFGHGLSDIDRLIR
jgi:hypothetical protein